MSGSNHTDHDIYRLLTDSVKDHAIILLDTDGNIKSWNSGAELIKGYKAAEIIGQNFRKFYTKEDIDKKVPEQLLRDAVRHGYSHYEGWRVRKDGSRFWAEVTLSALHDNLGTLIGFSKITHDHTRQKRAEEEKDKIERVLGITSETARIGAWEIDLTTNTLILSSVNRKIREIGDDIELTPLQGRQFFKEGEHRDRVQKALEQALREGTPYDLEVLCVTATGRELWCRVLGQPEFKDGRCVKVFGILQDIDTQKRIQIQLEQSEEKFRSSFDLAGIGMGLLNMHGTFILVNKRLCSMLGYTEQELFALTFADITHPDDISESMIRNKRLINGQLEYIQMTKRYLHKSGTPVWVNVNVSLIRNETGEPLHFIMQAEDLTEQKKAEEDRRKIEQVFDISTHSARIGVWENDLTTGKMTWSKMAKKMRELPDDYEPTLEAAYSYFKEGESRDTIIRSYERAVKDGTPYDVEVIMVTATGREVWCRSISQPEFRDGKCVRVFGILMDIDAQKRAQIELRESEEKFRSSFELAGIGMALIGLDQKAILLNKRMHEILGYEGRELYELSAADITHPDDRHLNVELTDQLIKGKIKYYQYTKRLLHKNGSIVWANMNVSLVRNTNGDPLHFVSEVEDITEKKKLEEEKTRIQQVLDSLSETARIGIWEVNLSEQKVNWSRVAKRIHEVPDDYEPEIGVGLSFYKPGENLQRINDAIYELAVNGIPFDLELQHITALGNERWCRVIGQAEFVNGTPTRIFGIIQDIDARKRAEIELQESEQKFRNSFELAGIGMVLLSPGLRPIMVNKRICEILGYTDQELYAMTVPDFTHPDDLDMSVHEANELLKRKKDYYQLTKRYIHKTGAIVWASITVALVYDTQGDPLHFIVEIEDITERKKLEEEKGKTQLVLDSMSETARIGAWEVDLTTQKVTWSRVTRMILDLPDDFEVNMGIGSVLYQNPDDYDKVSKAYQKAITTGTPFDLEVLRLTATGREIWCRMIGRAEFKDGKPTRIYGIMQDIDSQKRTQIELQESEEQFRNSFELAGIGMAIITLDHKLILVNKRFCEMLGYTEQELYALTVPDFTHPDDLDLTLRSVGNLVAGNVEHYQITKRYIHKSGAIVWVNINVALVKDTQGKPLHCISEIEDITERKKLEEEQGKAKLVLDSMSETARIGAWEVDLSTQKLIWSRVAKVIHDVPDDYETDVQSGASFYKSGSDREKMEQVYTAAITNGTPFDIEIIQLTAKGREIWCRIIGQPEFKDGKCIRLFGIIQDIDSQKRTQVELQLREEQLSRSFDMSALGMALLTLNGRPIRVNNRLCEILGYTMEEAMTLNTVVVTYPEDVAEDIRLGEQLLAGEIDYYHRVKRFVHKSGSIIWSHVTLSLVRDVEGRPAHFVCEIEDITERKKQEDELKRVNEELTAIFNSSAHVSIIGTDIDGTITLFNKGAEKLTCYTADEVIGKMTPEALHPKDEIIKRSLEIKQEYGKDVRGFDALVENARVEGHYATESIYKRKDGSTYPAHQVISPIIDSSGKIVGYLGISTDITELKEAEAMMRKYAQLEAKNKEMEQFTFIASHDLLQPLQTIRSFVSLLDEEYRTKLDETAEKYIGFISASTGRMIDLVKGLLDYSRLGRVRKLESIDTNELLKNVLDDLALQITESKAEITYTNLPKLNVYPIEFKQLLQNLIANAIKFRRPEVSPKISISAHKDHHKWTFEVSDNGIGINNKNKELIFVLFQRLHDRHEYEGMGIGLANCKKIVELHNGNIWVESTPGRGSTFYFTVQT